VRIEVRDNPRDVYARYLAGAIGEDEDMDIRSNGRYPANALSNFAAHPFVLDGVQIASMEGFLQGLKFKSRGMQVEVCKLVGLAAKRRGARKRWKKTGKLYWRGREIDRHGPAYQELLDRAYRALYENAGFKRALLSSGLATLKHSLGRRKESETILTVSEFCGRLTRLRDRLRAEIEAKTGPS
jgi:hypothetical protein